MFETVELRQTMDKKPYEEAESRIREQLIAAQTALRESNTSVVIVLAGVEKAGTGAMANLINEWLDPRWVDTHAMGVPTEEERLRPAFWRYWTALPARGRVGVFLDAWYRKPLLDTLEGQADETELERRLTSIVQFERMLSLDGTLIIKLWMHLDREAQRERLEALASDPLRAWRVTEGDWKQWEQHAELCDVAQRIIARTSNARAPWTLVEGYDHRYRCVQVAGAILDALNRHLEERQGAATERSDPSEAPASALSHVPRRSVLDSLEIPAVVKGAEYRDSLERLQGRVARLQRRAQSAGVSMVLAFEGWDAAGKGGAIRRVTAALDARTYQVVPIGAPTDEERAHHYLWRFWRRLPRAGGVTFFDRTWYGRVLVERVEGFATSDEWRRAYGEINTFESQLVADETVVLKFWLHITKSEQAKRFKERERTPHKAFKLTEEDWRNREKWNAYTDAVHDMVERTSTADAPWTLVQANDKRGARLRVLQTIGDRLAAALGGDTMEELR